MAALRWSPAVIFLILIFYTACQEAAQPPTIVNTPPPPIIRLGLANSAAPFAAVIEAYPAAADKAIIQSINGNTETLWHDLENGRLEAILVHHLPPGQAFWFNPVALDGLTIIVHPDNPMEAISLAEAQALFNGRVQNWKELGGLDQPVTIISREAGSGALALLQQMVLTDQRLNINAQIAPSNQGMLTMVSEAQQAIGFTTMNHTEGIKVLRIDQLVATPESTADQSYPLTSPLYFVHKNSGEPEGELRAFLAWLQSDDGQTVISEQYGRVQ